MAQRERRPCFLFVVGMQSTKIGGMEKFLLELSREMEALGWSTVFCFDGEPSATLRTYFQSPFVTLESVPEQQGLGQNAALALWNILRKHRPDVFMYAFHSVMRVFPWIAKAAGVKRIYFNDHSSRPQGVVPQPLRLDKRLIGRLLTSPLTRIISVSEFTRRTGAAYAITSAPSVVVRNGVEVLERDEVLGRQFRDQHAIPADAVVATEICWMMPIKGVDVMLDAAGELLARHPRLHFLFVGGGEKLQSYRDRAEQMQHGDRVHFLGLVNEPVRAGVLDASDIYCQPSIWQEAAPLAVLEAMSKRLPVIASDVGGLPEMVLDKITGLLVRSGSATELGDALEQLILDQNLRENLGRAGAERVMTDHRLKKTVATYAELLTRDRPTATSGR